MDRWGLNRISTISKDLGDIGTADRVTDITGISAVCTSLQVDVEAAQAYAPFTDISACTDWTTALAQAATDFKDSTSNNLDGIY